jgi:heme exporter protein D
VSFLADQQYQWFFWLAPILALRFVAILVMLSVGYVRKVLIPRYRGKRVE